MPAPSPENTVLTPSVAEVTISFSSDLPIARLARARGPRIESIDFGDFGINLHSGGPGVNVGRFSAGCQVVWSPKGFFGKTWHRFFDPAVAAMDEAKQSLMPYMLVNKTN